jgi:hypothetical protein
MTGSTPSSAASRARRSRVARQILGRPGFQPRVDDDREPVGDVIRTISRDGAWMSAAGSNRVNGRSTRSSCRCARPRAASSVRTASGHSAKPDRDAAAPAAPGFRRSRRRLSHTKQARGQNTRTSRRPAAPARETADGQGRAPGSPAPANTPFEPEISTPARIVSVSIERFEKHVESQSPGCVRASTCFERRPLMSRRSDVNGQVTEQNFVSESLPFARGCGTRSPSLRASSADSLRRRQRVIAGLAVRPQTARPPA